MSSSASGPQGPIGAPREGSSEASSVPEQAPDPALLEEVLRQTSEVCDSEEPLDDADREALLEVARRYPSQPLCPRPVTVELVQAVLRTHFPAVSRTSELWEAISVQIAETLFEDAVSRERLNRFWHRLAGEQ